MCPLSSANMGTSYLFCFFTIKHIQQYLERSVMSMFITTVPVQTRAQSWQVDTIKPDYKAN